MHHRIIDRLWKSPNNEFDTFPYTREEMFINLDPDFERRLDALIQPQERVALLLGLVNDVLEKSSFVRDDKEPERTPKPPRLHLLVRKPSLPGAKSVGERGGDYMPARKHKIPNKSSDLEVDPSEAECVRAALSFIMRLSGRRHRADANGSSKTSDT